MKRTESLAWGLIALVVAVVVGLTLAFSGSDTTSTQAVSSEDATTVDVDIQGMSFVPASVAVEPGTRLVLNITNSDTQQHDLKLGGEHSLSLIHI